MTKPMSRFEIENAVHQIDGYYDLNTAKQETKKQAFEKAKAETIKNFERYLANIKEITLDQFMRGTHRNNCPDCGQILNPANECTRCGKLIVW